MLENWWINEFDSFDSYKLNSRIAFEKAVEIDGLPSLVRNEFCVRSRSRTVQNIFALSGWSWVTSFRLSYEHDSVAAEKTTQSQYKSIQLNQTSAFEVALHTQEIQERVKSIL